MKFSFFCQRHTLSTSFDIFIVTYKVTNFLPKLVDMLLFSAEKTEFPFFEIPYFWVLQVRGTGQRRYHSQRFSALGAKSNTCWPMCCNHVTPAIAAFRSHDTIPVQNKQLGQFNSKQTRKCFLPSAFLT